MQSNKKQTGILIYTPDYVQGTPGLNLYAIYPDYWKDKWGQPPCFGYVKETSPYWAVYAAYTAGLVPPNATFKPKPVLMKNQFKKKPKSGPYNRPAR